MRGRSPEHVLGVALMSVTAAVARSDAGSRSRLVPPARTAPAIEHHSNVVEQPWPLARRDTFAPLLTNPQAELMREHVRSGQATHSVPSAGAPEPLTLFDDGRRRIN